MADEEVIVEESNADEAEAINLGWTPKDKWKGNADRWVDATTFMNNARIVMPILRKQNQELHQTVNSLVGELRATKATVATLEESYEEDLVLRVKEAEKGLAARLKEARDSGDTEEEIKILGERDDLAAAKNKDKKAGSGEGTPPAKTEQVHPEYTAWLARNPQVQTDLAFARKAIAVGNTIILEPNAPAGRAFFDEVDRRLAELEPPRPRESKVGGGAPPAGGNNGGKGKGYNALPAEAKQACDSMTIQKVGANRKYKTESEWQAAYAANYHNLEKR